MTVEAASLRSSSSISSRASAHSWDKTLTKGQRRQHQQHHHHPHRHHYHQRHRHHHHHQRRGIICSWKEIDQKRPKIGKKKKQTGKKQSRRRRKTCSATPPKWHATAQAARTVRNAPYPICRTHVLLYRSRQKGHTRAAQGHKTSTKRLIIFITHRVRAYSFLQKSSRTHISLQYS